MPTSTARTALVLTAMFLAVAVVFGAVVGFLAIGTSISKVEITAGSPVCTGTEVDNPPGAIRLRAGMKCRVPVMVRNMGRLAVDLDEVVLPFMGSRGGAAVQVKTWEGREPGVADVDAVFDVDRHLEPGDTWDTEIHYDFRPGGCTTRGTFSTPGLDVGASAWGRSVRLVGPGALFKGTAESEC